MAAAPTIPFDAFEAVDIRIGTILDAQPFPQARKPAYKLTVDFGPEIGIKRSSAQITARYETAALVGRRVMAVVNFAPRQVGPFLSEVLCLGFHDVDDQVVLATVDRANVPDGRRLL